VSRRSWETLRNNRRAARGSSEHEEKTRLGHMLASAGRSFALEDVKRRLDAADEQDRKDSEVAPSRRLDLGDDD